MADQGRIKLTDAIANPIGGGAEPDAGTGAPERTGQPPRIPRAQPTAPPNQEERTARNRFVVQNQTAAEPEPDEAPEPARQRGESAAEHAKRTMKLRFRHNDIELPEEEVIKLAQKGMSAQRLDERRNELEQIARQNERRLAVANDLERIASVDPARYQRALDILLGQAQPQAQGVEDSEEDGLTTQPAPRTVDTALERRLAALEARTQQAERSFHQKDYETRMGRALEGQEYLRGNPEAGEIARELLEVALAKGEFDNPEDAAPIVASRVKRMVQGHLEAERRTREARRETAAPRTPAGIPQLPRLDRKHATVQAHKSGAARSALRDLYRNMQSMMRGTNPNI